MKFEKIINITITKEEQEILKQAETLLDEICRCFATGCQGCPLEKICSERGAPDNYLHNCINALPVEE